MVGVEWVISFFFESSIIVFFLFILKLYPIRLSPVRSRSARMVVTAGIPCSKWQEVRTCTGAYAHGLGVYMSALAYWMMRDRHTQLLW